MAEEAKDETISEKKETEEKAPEPEKVEKNKVEEDKQETEYRPKPKTDETVPLKKYLDLKTEVKTLKKDIERLSDDKSNLSNTDLDALAEEHNLDKDVIKKLAASIKNETLKEAEKKIAPFLAEKQKEQNEKNFDKVFKEKTLKKYPHLADQKEKFKRMVMSPDFVDMSEQQIIDEYFPAPSKDSPEEGSQGGAKGEESVDFSKMTPEQHARVLKDPVSREKYYKWQDSQ